MGGEGNQLMETRISSSTKELIISDDNPTELIGERINPADKKKLQEALKAKNLEAKLDNLS
jgi:cobalamin-dependent methionine synthase I